MNVNATRSSVLNDDEPCKSCPQSYQATRIRQGNVKQNGREGGRLRQEKPSGN